MGNEVQHEVINLLNKTSRFFGTQMVASLNASSLAGPSGQISELPNDQWRTEFRFMVALTLAKLQIVLTDYAVGPQTRDLANDYKTGFPPLSDAGKKLCQKVKMRKAGGFV